TLDLLVYVRPRRPDPGLECTGQDVPGRVPVSMQGEPAMRTVVPPDGEILADKGTAAAALLARPPRIHFHVGDPRTLSLGSQRKKEARPAGIADRSGQPVVLEHPPDVQALDRDEPVATDQLQGDLVVMLLAEPSHPDMDLGDLPPRLAAVLP